MVRSADHRQRRHEYDIWVQVEELVVGKNASFDCRLTSMSTLLNCTR